MKPATHEVVATGVEGSLLSSPARALSDRFLHSDAALGQIHPSFAIWLQKLASST